MSFCCGTPEVSSQALACSPVPSTERWTIPLVRHLVDQQLASGPASRLGESITFPTEETWVKEGNAAISLLSDGVIKFDGGAIFGPVPKVLWERLTPSDRQNRIHMGLNCLLVQTGSMNVLIDTGVGTKESQRIKDIYGLTTSKLLRNLRERGLAAKDIHAVVLSHLHFDHAGGCTKLDRSGSPVPTFPKAMYYVQREAWQDANNPSERSRAAYHADDFVPLHEKGQLTLLDGDGEVVPGVWVNVTHAHTPGHQVVFFNHGSERMAFLGDLVPTPYHVKLPYITAFDHSPEMTLECKRELLGRAEREGWLIVFSHGYQERAGYLERRNNELHMRIIEL